VGHGVQRGDLPDRVETRMMDLWEAIHRSEAFLKRAETRLPPVTPTPQERQALQTVISAAAALSSLALKQVTEEGAVGPKES
jgi:hypothetical protein